MGESSGREICRILLVDDHKLLMEGVRILLAPHAHLRVAGMALCGGQAVPERCVRQLCRAPGTAAGAVFDLHRP